MNCRHAELYNTISTRRQINTKNSKRIPVPDPGVPALPETDTFLRLPQVGPRMDLLFKCWPACSPSPYINKLTGHFKFSYRGLMARCSLCVEAVTRCVALISFCSPHTTQQQATDGPVQNALDFGVALAKGHKKVYNLPPMFADAAGDCCRLLRSLALAQAEPVLRLKAGCC
ncbi:hypothetical protein ACLKA7_007606 [Drosophila subpalustris]